MVMSKKTTGFGIFGKEEIRTRFGERGKRA
jgi:hypothetical protein